MAAFSKTAATTENMTAPATAAVFGPLTAVDALPATEYGVFAQELVLAATYENMSDSTSWLSSLADAMESIDTETWTSCEASVMARTLAAFGQHMRAYETNATARLSRLGGELLLASRQIIVKDELRIEWEQQAHADINERDGEIAALKDEIATLKAALAAHAHEMPGTESQSNTDSTATTVPVASDSESTTSSRDAEVPARTGIPQPQLDQSPKLHEQLTQSLPAQDAPLDDAALECAAVQTRAGHSLALIVRQLAEIGDWDVIFQADTLTVYTDRFATAPVTSASILGALTTQGQQLGSLMPKCSATLKSVPHASPDRQWLTDRHKQLCRDVTHVHNWVVGLAYTMCELTESVDREDGPVWQWSPPVDPGPMISADEMRSTARAVGGFYVSCLSSWAVPLQTKPNDFSTLERGSSVLRDVEERIEEVSAVCEWSDLSALATRFADVVAMIDQKLVLCSKAVFLDTRRVSQKNKTKIVRSDSAVFPASRFSLAYYQQVLTKLTKVHTAMIEAAKEGCAKDRRSEIAQLAAQEVRDVLAGVQDWADPRFDKETNASPSEKAAYVDLIYWSESLLEEIRYEMEVHAAC